MSLNSFHLTSAGNGRSIVTPAELAALHRKISFPWLRRLWPIALFLAVYFWLRRRRS